MMKHIVLNSGKAMPILGLGTYKIRGAKNINSTIDTALGAGYRSFDTAEVYRNETDIGNALNTLLPKYSLKREDVFITSKLPPKSQGGSNSREACLASIEKLGTGYLDLYLIHWPGTQGKKPEDPINKEMRKESWRELEKLYDEGKLKSIGVSNYTTVHLDSLLSWCTVKPAVLQIEYHPYLIQTDLVTLCQANNIHFQAYSSLGTSSAEQKNIKLMSDPCLVKIAKALEKSPAQILLKWTVQQGIGVLPKSETPQHITENIEIFDFEIPEQYMQDLNSLNKGQHFCWDPATVS